jgi:SAM-dependent methyltransferase
MSDSLLRLSGPDELLGLGYFDFLACMGPFSIHVRGPQSTQEVLSAAQVRVGDEVLEVGCGTGYTTALLTQAGARVTVVDVNPSMIEATTRTCRSCGLRPPQAYCTDAAAAPRVLRGRSFDFVLCECVLGFVHDKQEFTSGLPEVLTPAGRVGVVDVYYHTPPPESLVEELGKVFGSRLAVLTRDDWSDLFAAYELGYWQEYPLGPDGPLVTAANLEKQFQQRGLSQAVVPWLTPDVVEQCAARWSAWEALFARNRRYLRHFVAVWN